ncbi:N-acetyltransferase [Streptomyces sp. MUSC 14]|uniref:GNAT family N-acetyltransferase n=1 Tax=Streptomyces sp. MUSC 14 TaxID=1354889 RepID=UPI0008F5C59F|nr:GNAT family N-acetyltransferase [Streptomyces sp. MUSC 14]OIJ90030.1 N-acetyltransferase [Streptomyces sp. MUSC 14]
MHTTGDGTTVPGTAGTVAYRPARPGDRDALTGFDSSFTTDWVYEVTVREAGFGLRRIPVAPPLHKTFPDDDTDEPAAEDGHTGSTRTTVAVAGAEVCGFVTASFAPWNARLTIRDIEVAPAWRGKGIGRDLMRLALGFARECGAAHMWLEVSNVNAPAIGAYLRMGFTFCGLDTSLYDGTESAGEVALFMSRRVDRPAPGL